MKKIFLFILLFTSALQGYSQILKKRIPNKLVVLTFDDAPKTHFTFVAPLLKKYHFNATFFVCEFPPNYSDTSKYMSWKEIKQLDKMGFEIGNHTKTHKHVNKLTKDQFVSELEYIESKCDSLHIAKPITFAYPGYDTYPMATVVLKEKGYKFARAGGDRLYNPLIDYPELVPGFTTTKTNKQQIMDAFSQAKQGKIVVLTIHGVPDYEHDWVTTPPALFEEYMKYLHDNHFKVIAMKDLLKYIDADKAFSEMKPDYSQK